MGVGMNGLEATTTPYQGFIDDLVNQGIISKRAYSVYLDNLGKLSISPSNRLLTYVCSIKHGWSDLGRL